MKWKGLKLELRGLRYCLGAAEETHENMFPKPVPRQKISQFASTPQDRNVDNQSLGEDSILFQVGGVRFPYFVIKKPCNGSESTEMDMYDGKRHDNKVNGNTGWGECPLLQARNLVQNGTWPGQS